MKSTLILLLVGAILSSGCATPPSAGANDDASLFGRTAAEREEQGGSAPDLSGEIRLDFLLHAALEQNPRIGAARQRALAAAEGPAADAWLPDPTLMVGWYESSVETRVGPQEWSIGIQQKVPFPTKLRTRARMEGAKAERQAILYEAVVRDVLTEVVRTAFELAYLYEAIEITEEISPLLDRYVAAAAGEGESGSPLPELFRAETQRAQLENDRIVLAELRAAEETRLRSLLALPPDAPVGTPAVPAVPGIEAGFADLLTVLREENQELRAAGIAQEVAELRTSLARQRRLPDLTFGVSRIFTGELDPDLGMDPKDNGKDPLVFSAGVTIPLWVQKDQAAIRQARALERAANFDRLQTAQDLRAKLARVWFRVGNNQRLVVLYRDVLVPRAAAAARTAEDLVTAGKGSLAGILETIATYHSFRLALARARADHGQAVAELESILGRPFTRAEEEGS